MGFLKDIAGGIIAGGIQAAVQGGPRRQYKWNKRAANDANQMNRENQQWLLQQQKDIQAEQRAYDSPEAQMQRYLAAGLNPHLIYGTGTSAGQAFAMNAPGVPAVNIQAPSASYPNPVPGFIQAAQAQAQLGLTAAKTSESYYKQALIDVQTRIAETNPMLNPSVVSAITDSMIAVANDKTNTVKETWMEREFSGEGYWKRTTLGAEKVKSQVELLSQRFQLNQSDLSIKNQILSSKEF